MGQAHCQSRKGSCLLHSCLHMAIFPLTGVSPACFPLASTSPADAVCKPNSGLHWLHSLSLTHLCMGSPGFQCLLTPSALWKSLAMPTDLIPCNHWEAGAQPFQATCSGSTPLIPLPAQPPPSLQMPALATSDAPRDVVDSMAGTVACWLGDDVRHSSQMLRH